MNRKPTHRRFLGRLRCAAGLAACTGLAVALVGSAGCNIVGPAVYFIHGPEKIDAQFELPEDKAVVIFIDDRENVLRDRSMRTVIARATEQALLDGDAAPKGEIISSEGIAAVTAADRWGRPQGIAQVGQAVGADIVIYATIDTFTLSADGTSLSPTGAMRVKVVDTESRERLWPTGDQEWAPVGTVVPRRDGTVPSSLSARVSEEHNLAKRMGADLANIFLRHLANPRENEVGR